MPKIISDSPKKISIIGGGIAGCITALELAKQGYEVTIFEQKEDVLMGTSAGTPGRMGLGYHYFHSKTAKRYMNQTINFMKEYSDCFLGDESSPYLQNGRYFIVKGSLVNYQNLMAAYDEISGEFEEIIKKDPSKNVFGTTHLHKTLKKTEYQNDVKIDLVDYAIETKERLLDWQKFSRRIKAELAKSSIVIKNNFEVKTIQQLNGGGFEIIDKSKESYKTNYIVNCAWQNVENINSKLGIGEAHSNQENKKNSVTCRMKLLVEVQLPESLREKHSMFFCVGPHAMFSNLGNGIGRITYAPVTNHSHTTELEMPKHFKKWLAEGLSEEETLDYGQKIIKGVSEYIPAMADAKIIKIVPGIVKSKGSIDLEDVNSPFHERDYSGVEEQQIGWVDNAAMKLFYCLGNAKEVANIISKHAEKKGAIIEILKTFEKFETAKTSDTLRGIKFNYFLNHLERNFKLKDFESGNLAIFATIQPQILKKEKTLSQMSEKSSFKKSAIKDSEGSATDSELLTSTSAGLSVSEELEENFKLPELTKSISATFCQKLNNETILGKNKREQRFTDNIDEERKSKKPANQKIINF